MEVKRKHALALQIKKKLNQYMHLQHVECTIGQSLNTSMSKGAYIYIYVHVSIFRPSPQTLGT